MRALKFVAVTSLLALVATTAQADALTDLEGPFRAALQSGSWVLALGLIFAAGLATSLTPCVYPMIVITVSVFGARETTSRLEAAKLSTAFVLGIATLFTPLGVIAGMTGGVFGSQLSSPVVLVGLAVLFVALALSMFGAFELDLPSGLKNRLATVGGVGVKGAFVLGIASGLIAAPCTGPVVGALLAFIGTTGSVALGAASFFTYAIGLGMLFWLVGTFSMTLPRSGAWVEAIKSVFGVLMLASALFVVRDLLPDFMSVAERSPVLLAAAGGLVIGGVLLGAIHLSFHGAGVIVRARKALGIALSTAGLFALVAYAEALPPGARVAWLDDYTSARALAQQKGQPLFVDFGASWCGACGELDHETFSDPRIVRESERFVAVRVDLSPGQDSPQKRKVLAAYEQRGLPLVVLHDSEGEEAARVTSFLEPDKFLSLMQKVQ